MADLKEPESAGQLVKLGSKALFAYDVTELPAYHNYAVLMGLPPQAVPSIMLAVKMHRELQRRCKEQWKLLSLPGAAAKLIMSRKELTAWQVQASGEFAKSHGLPLDCIYAMETRTRFQNGILSTGYRLLAQADPRILRHAGLFDVQAGVMETSQAIPGSTTGAKLQQSVPWVRCVYKITFWNGEEYMGVGMADGNDDAVKQRGTSQMPSIAETRAANHAYRAALRMTGGGVSEEEEESEEDSAT